MALSRAIRPRATVYCARAFHVMFSSCITAQESGCQGTPTSSRSGSLIWQRTIKTLTSTNRKKIRQRFSSVVWEDSRVGARGRSSSRLNGAQRLPDRPPKRDTARSRKATLGGGGDQDGVSPIIGGWTPRHDASGGSEAMCSEHNFSGINQARPHHEVA
jgi:hypothetical protein